MTKEIEIIKRRFNHLKMPSGRSLELIALKTSTGRHHRSYKAVHEKLLSVLSSTPGGIVVLPEWAYSLKTDSQFSPLLEKIKDKTKQRETMVIVTPRIYQHDVNQTKVYAISNGEIIYERDKGTLPKKILRKWGLKIGIEICVENSFLRGLDYKKVQKDRDLLLVPSCGLICDERKINVESLKPGGYGVLLDGHISLGKTGFFGVVRKKKDDVECSL